eukprot:scaffold169_cov134-Cylindrotheca_fusiformis.AAC.2
MPTSWIGSDVMSRCMPGVASRVLMSVSAVIPWYCVLLRIRLTTVFKWSDSCSCGLILVLAEEDIPGSLRARKELGNEHKNHQQMKTWTALQLKPSPEEDIPGSQSEKGKNWETNIRTISR